VRLRDREIEKVTERETARDSERHRQRQTQSDRSAAIGDDK
jgi:hypothetical protein